jgi:regulator of replication initiation timing
VDRKALQDKVNGLLGFRVTERGNDAVVEFFVESISPITGPKVRAVHPATVQEVALYLKVLGLVARLDELTAENNKLRSQLDDAIQKNNALENEADALLRQRDDAAEDSTSMRARVSELEDGLRAAYGDMKRDRKKGELR